MSPPGPPLADSALRPHSLYASRRWLELQERGARGPAYYVTGDGNANRGVGLLPVHRTRRTSNPYYSPAHLLRGIPSEHVPGTVALTGPLSGYHWDVPVARGTSREHALAKLATAALATLASGEALLFPYLVSDCAAALGNGHALLEAVDAWLDVPCTDFTAYLDAAPARLRHEVRRDLDAFHRADLTHSWEPLADCAASFAPLTVQTSGKYHVSERAEDIESYFRAMADVFGEDAVVFTARRDGRLVGGVLAFIDNQTIWLRLVGFDYAAVPGSAYFVLYFHAPRQLAMERNFRQVHLGLSYDRTKRTRGARLEPLWTTLIGPVLPAAVIARANDTRFAELRPIVGTTQRASFLDKVRAIAPDCGGGD